MKVLFLAIAVTIAVQAGSFAQQLSGSVRSSSGQPLAHVYIFPDRSLNHIAETDDNGTFTVRQFETVIAFRRDGFRPLTKIIDLTTTKLDIVLEDAASSEWTVPRCNDARDRIGFALRLRVPKGAIGRKGRDVDYESFAIGYGPKTNRVWLSGISGPYGSLGIPPYAWILNATEFTERSYRGRGVEGADLRGRLRDGTYWRYLGRLGQSVEYSGVTKEQAAFFDAVIDGACTN